MKILESILFSVGIVLVITSCSSNNNWPQFRGPDADNISIETDLPVEWNSEQNLLWKYKIPGKGWSSPIIWGDKVFITTAFLFCFLLIR